MAEWTAADTWISEAEKVIRTRGVCYSINDAQCRGGSGIYYSRWSITIAANRSAWIPPWRVNSNDGLMRHHARKLSSVPTANPTIQLRAVDRNDLNSRQELQGWEHSAIQFDLQRQLQ